MAGTARAAGFDRVIGFDMGGTSTDVSHFAGDYERTSDAVVAGYRPRPPQPCIPTVAGGGRSHFPLHIPPPGGRPAAPGGATGAGPPHPADTPNLQHL